MRNDGKLRTLLTDGKVFPALIAFCLLLPNIHYAGLASQTVIPREFFLYFYSIVFVIALVRLGSVRYNTFYLLSLAFLCWQLIALAWSSDLKRGLEDLLNFYSFLLTSWVLFQLTDSGKKQLLINTLIASVAAAALIGIWQNFGWNPLPIYQAAPPSSTFVNKNLAASATYLFLPASLAMLMLSEARSHKLLFWLSSTLLLAFVLISHTKGVWLAAAGCLLLTVVFYNLSDAKAKYRGRLRENRIYILSMLIVSFVLFMLPGTRNQGAFDLEQYSPSSMSSMVRLGFYRDALELIQRDPIAGIGTGSLRRDFRAQPGGPYQRQHAEQDRYLSRLHNDHLQYLVEQGLIGFILWASMIGTLFVTTLKFLRRQDTAWREQLLVFSLLMGISGMLVHALVSFPLRSPATASLFWVCIGLLLSFQTDSKHSKVVTITPLVRYVATPLLLAVSIFSINGITKDAIGSYLLKTSGDNLSQGRCFASKLYLDNAIQADGMNLRSAQLLSLNYDACRNLPPELALKTMDSILAYEPNHARALLLKGDIYYRLEAFPEAAAYYRKTLLVNPSSARAYLGLARIDLAEKRYAEALNKAEKALALDENNREAQKLISAMPH